MTTEPTTLDRSTVPSLRDQVARLRRLGEAGISLAYRRQAAGVESCDFVELAPLRGGRWMFAVGDAKASGPEALSIAAEVGRRLVLGASAARHPGELLASANEVVREIAPADGFVAVVVFFVDGRRRTFRMANAGHPAPLAIGRAGGAVCLDLRGPALGLLPGVSYRESGPMRLPPGMVVLAATDGVRDAVDAQGRPFGVDGVSRALAGARAAGPRGVVRRVLAEVAAHGLEDEADDRTALAFSFRSR